ncbi:MAG: helix-turn-helix domain-containing protein [Chloroflexi bacterium]|nr:helix-turn-helix domain-containing protein [Chloroflexota bacterium]
MTVVNADRTIEHYISAFNMTSFLNDDLLDYLQLFHFPAYSNIYIEQDEQDYLHFLVEGQVQCHHYHPNGKLAVFALMKPFAAVGDLEILNKERVKSNVIATQDTTMLGIASPIIHRYGVDDPRFLRFLIDQLKKKLYAANFWQENHVLPVINRLSLYMLAGVASNGEMVLPGKEELASLLGTTTRHLNRVLKQLVESGSISDAYPAVRILDREALDNLVGE